MGITLIAIARFRDALQLAGIENYALGATTLSLVYGSIGYLAFFTDHLPPQVLQLYAITNCSLLSVFYLRSLPQELVWFTLVGIILWGKSQAINGRDHEPLFQIRSLCSRRPDPSTLQW